MCPMYLVDLFSKSFRASVGNKSVSKVSSVMLSDRRKRLS